MFQKLICSSTVFLKEMILKGMWWKYSPATKEGFKEFLDAQSFLAYSFIQLYHWLYEVNVLFTYQLDN